MDVLLGNKELLNVSTYPKSKKELFCAVRLKVLP